MRFKVLHRFFSGIILVLVMGVLLLSPGVLPYNQTVLAQQLTAIVDDTLSNGIIDVNVNGEASNLQIEVKNNKPYWTNLRISSIGTESPQPANITTQFCSEIGAIPPNTTLTYQATFTTNGQAITFFVDITPESGWNAATLNFIKVIVQLISPSAYVVGEDIPFILDLVNTLTGLSDVIQNLGRALNPKTNLIDSFKYIGLTAKGTLEILNTPENRATIGLYLEKMTWFKNNQIDAAQISVLLNKVTQIAKLIDIFWQEANMIWDATVGEPAGSVMVKAVETVPDYTLNTSVNPSGSGTISPSTGYYDSGTILTLHAWPAVEYVFDHWEGDVSGNSSSTTITMSSNKNVVAYFAQITNPDLTVSPVLFEPALATNGQTISVIFTVKNKGGTSSGTFYNRLSLANTEWGTNYSLGNFVMDSLAPGESETVTLTTNPVSTNVPFGDYFVTVYADGFEAVDEQNEMNNIGSSTPEKIHIGDHFTVGADAVWLTSLSNPSINTTASHIYDSFTVGADVLWLTGLSNPSVNTTASHIYDSFTVGADVLWLSGLSSSSINTTASHIYDYFTVGADAVWKRTFDMGQVIPGDANGDGRVNALDVTKLERIIAGLDPQFPFLGADANQDGSFNALDITKVERIIAGL